MPHTLLLADDSVTIQRVIELTFADEDIRVVAVSGGDQAITAMEQSRPDIVLVDAGMPGRNGYEVAEHMRRTPGLEDVPVLLLTGAFEPIDQARAEASGCSGVLVKPFEPQQVIARVQELLTRPQGAQGETGPPPALPVADLHGASAPRPPGSVDEYFERLDQAFGGLPMETPATRPADADARSAADDLMAWFASRSAGGADAAVAATPPPGAEPPLAQAFLALLDAERTNRPLSASLPPPMASDALVDDVARRVLDRLSDRVVRSAVAEVVTSVAERLVREEIDRIRDTIEGDDAPP